MTSQIFLNVHQLEGQVVDLQLRDELKIIIQSLKRTKR